MAAEGEIWFARQLQRFGPDALADDATGRPTLPDARRYTRSVAQHHYENFPVVSGFVPRRYRQPMADIYAYCRWADDLSDEVEGAQRSLDLLQWWRQQLLRCYDPSFGPGAPWPHPVMVALRQTIRDFDIPSAPFLDLISAFEQDQRQPRYPTFDQLIDYCRRSADPVGRIMLHLMGRFSATNAALSDKICTGLQLANFWQDVARDAAIDRIYLPADDMARFGVTEDDLRQKAASDALRELLKFEVARAEAFFDAGQPLVGRLSGRWRVVIAGFAEGGRAILRKIRDVGYDVVTQRPKLRKAELMGVLGRSLKAALWTPGSKPQPIGDVTEHQKSTRTEGAGQS